MILISKCYEIITPESCKHGDAESRGFFFQDYPHSFKDLLAEMKGSPRWEPSQFPVNESNAADTWLTDYSDNYANGARNRQELESGNWSNHSLHYSHDNNPRALKYWIKALRYHNIIKERL